MDFRPSSTQIIVGNNTVLFVYCGNEILVVAVTRFLLLEKSDFVWRNYKRTYMFYPNIIYEVQFARGIFIKLKVCELLELFLRAPEFLIHRWRSLQ